MVCLAVSVYQIRKRYDYKTLIHQTYETEEYVNRCRGGGNSWSNSAVKSITLSGDNLHLFGTKLLAQGFYQALAQFVVPTFRG